MWKVAILVSILLLAGCDAQARRPFVAEYQPGTLDHRTCEFNEFADAVYSFCTTEYGLNSFVCFADGVCYSHCCIINP